MTEPTEAEVEAATEAICATSGRKICHPDAMAHCLCRDHARAALTAAAQVRERMGDWRDITTAPKDEMFIWAAPKGGGKWGLGLAYRNVSGGWSDAYGGDAPARATYWKPIGQPPQLLTTEPDSGPDVLGMRKGEE